MKTCALIYNPIAGRHPARREKQIRQAADILQGSGLRVRVAATTAPEEAQTLARDAAGDGTDLILVCGGDGTINEVINGLAPGRTPLGILPGGTANMLAKELRLPHDPVRAAAEVLRWTPRRIALGQATWNVQAAVTPGFSPAHAALKGGATGAAAPNRRYFASVAGIGFDAQIVCKLSPHLKLSWGVAGYVFEAFRQWVRYPFPLFICKTEERESRATFAVVQRTGVYAGWLHLSPRANIFEPRFTVCTFPSRSRGRYLLYAAAVLMRRHLRLRDVEMVDAWNVSCSLADTSVTPQFELDGELGGTLPASFEIVPDALTLLVPPHVKGN